MVDKQDCGKLRIWKPFPMCHVSSNTMYLIHWIGCTRILSSLFLLDVGSF
jgi:hypothetical protein